VKEKEEQKENSKGGEKSTLSGRVTYNPFLTEPLEIQLCVHE